MRARRIWLGVVGVFALTIGFACWFPDYRLEREVAAAKSEGLWSELSDIPKAIKARFPDGENAAPIIRQAIAEGKKRGMKGIPDEPSFKRLLKGVATAADRAELRTKFEKNLDLLAEWRKASLYGRLDFER